MYEVGSLINQIKARAVALPYFYTLQKKTLLKYPTDLVSEHRSIMSANSVFSYTSSQTPIFDGEHYDYWNSQMETIFLSQDLWDIVEEGYEDSADPNSKDYKENVKKNATALRVIQQGVSKTIYPRIFGLKKAKEAWETLKIEFQGSEKVIAIRLQSLWSQFENLSMKEGELVKDFFSRVAEIINQIKSCGDAVPEKKVVEKILRSLPQKFEHIVAVITETRDLSKLTQYELMGSLEAHEQRVSKYNTQPLEQVFQAKANIPKKNFQQGRGGSSLGQSPNRGRGKNFPNGGRGRGRKEFSSQQKSGNSNSECFVCQKPGHESKNCWWKCTRCKIPNHSVRILATVLYFFTCLATWHL